MAFMFEMKKCSEMYINKMYIFTHSLNMYPLNYKLCYYVIVICTIYHMHKKFFFNFDIKINEFNFTTLCGWI